MPLKWEVIVKSEALNLAYLKLKSLYIWFAREAAVCMCMCFNFGCDEKRNHLLQFFSSEASAQSMTWLHQAEMDTQLPSLQDISDEPHVVSVGANEHFLLKKNKKQDLSHVLFKATLSNL